jgi:hypothetical protein
VGGDSAAPQEGAGAPTELSSGGGGVPVYRVLREGVLRKRPYLRKEWCIRAVEQPLRSERQEHNRYRFWAELPELEGKFLRVITLEDRSCPG